MTNRKTAGKRPVERQMIVDAAARLFRTKGYHATSMADIGAAVGRLGGSLYYHVDSKEGLLYEIVEVATRNLLAGVRELSRAPASPAERLRAMIISHLRLCVARSDYTVVFLNEISNLRDVQRRHTLLQLVKHYEDFFCQVIEEGMVAGEFRKGLDVKVTAYAILGMGNWALRWIRPEGRLSIDRIAAGFADLVIEGLRR
jgi:AcrR family transcriptional regulator